MEEEEEEEEEVQEYLSQSVDLSGDFKDVLFQVYPYLGDPNWQTIVLQLGLKDPRTLRSNLQMARCENRPSDVSLSQLPM